MQRNVLNSLDLLQQAKKTTLLTNSYLNLPDLGFFTKCNQQFRINKGVFNTIDHWFYEYGIINVAYRRIYILAFLDYVKEASKEDTSSHKFIKFGHGGLTNKLNDFITNYLNDTKESVNLYSVKF
jgi:hypothetical protein